VSKGKGKEKSLKPGKGGGKKKSIFQTEEQTLKSKRVRVGIPTGKEGECLCGNRGILKKKNRILNRKVKGQPRARGSKKGDFLRRKGKGRRVQQKQADNGKEGGSLL